MFFKGLFRFKSGAKHLEKKIPNNSQVLKQKENEILHYEKNNSVPNLESILKSKYKILKFAEKDKAKVHNTRIYTTYGIGLIKKLAKLSIDKQKMNDLLLEMVDQGGLELDHFIQTPKEKKTDKDYTAMLKRLEYLKGYKFIAATAREILEIARLANAGFIPKGTLVFIEGPRFQNNRSKHKNNEASHIKKTLYFQHANFYKRLQLWELLIISNVFKDSAPDIIVNDGMVITRRRLNNKEIDAQMDKIFYDEYLPFVEDIIDLFCNKKLDAKEVERVTLQQLEIFLTGVKTDMQGELRRLDKAVRTGFQLMEEPTDNEIKEYLLALRVLSNISEALNELTFVNIAKTGGTI